MSDWDRKERRADNMERLKEDISEIKTNIAILMKTVESNHHSLKGSVQAHTMLLERHDNTLYGDQNGVTVKISEVSQIRKEQQDHNIQDRWMFGTVITMLIFVLGKMFLK